MAKKTQQQLTKFLSTPQTAKQSEANRRTPSTPTASKAPLSEPLWTTPPPKLSIVIDLLDSDSDSESEAVSTQWKPNISSLQEKDWLTGDVIDAYFQLLVGLSVADKSLPRIHCFSVTFFQIWERHHSWEKLWKSVKEVNLFQFDLLLFPANVPLNNPNHWVLVVIHPKLKLVEFFNSSVSPDRWGLKQLVFHFFEYQVFMSQGEIILLDDYRGQDRWDTPRQTNGYDCGVFVCRYADCLSRKSTFDFTQEDMPAFRKQIKSQILRGSIQGETTATRWDVRPEVEIKRLREELQQINAKCEEAERQQRSFVEHAYQAMETRIIRQIQFVVQPAQLEPTDTETTGAIPQIQCERLVPTVVSISTVIQSTIRAPVFKAVAVRLPEPSTRPKPAPRIESAGRSVQTSPEPSTRPKTHEPSTRPKTPSPIESVACGVQTSPQTAHRYSSDSELDSPPNAANASRADRRAAIPHGTARRRLTFDAEANKLKRRRNNSSSSDDDAPKRKQAHHSSARSPMKNINTTLRFDEEVAPASPLPLVIDEPDNDIEYLPLDPHWLPYVREIDDDDDDDESNRENQSPLPTQPLPIEIESDDDMPVLPAAQARPIPLEYDSHKELSPPTRQNGCASLIRRHPVLGLRVEPLPPQPPDSANFRQFAALLDVDLQGVDLGNLWEDLEYRRQYLVSGQENPQQEKLILAHVPPAFHSGHFHLRALVALALLCYDEHIAFALIYSYTRMTRKAILNIFKSFHRNLF